MRDRIDITGLDKAAVLAALYNASRPQGMGFLTYNPTPMTAEDAQAILDEYGSDFDYLRGRVLKVNLAGSDFDPWLYDRDNGQGAAARAVAALRESLSVNAEAIRQAHKEGIEEAAERARDLMAQSTTTEVVGGVRTTQLGLAEMAGDLTPTVEAAEAANRENKPNA